MHIHMRSFLNAEYVRSYSVQSISSEVSFRFLTANAFTVPLSLYPDQADFFINGLFNKSDYTLFCPQPQSSV